VRCRLPFSRDAGKITATPACGQASNLARQAQKPDLRIASGFCDFQMVRSDPWIDSLVAPMWIASTAATAMGGFRMANALFPRDKPAALAMHTILLTLATIILLLTIAGALGLLYPWGMLLAVPAVQATVLAIVRRAAASRRLPDIEEPARIVPRRRPPWRRLLCSGLWLVVFSFVTAHVALHGLGYFPFDYDSLMYHIPLVDHWLQTRGLDATDTAHWWLAANNELLALWIVGPFSGDFLIGLNNLPIFALWVAAAIELGRLLRLPPAARHLGALAIVCVQPTFDQVARAANDLAVGVYWLAALCYALRYLRSCRRADLALYGVSVGLLGGVKYFAAGYAVVLLVAVGLALMGRNGWRRATRDVLLAVIFAAPFAGYWYFRNLVLTGSPLYPMGLREPLPEVGYPAGLWSTTLAGNRNPDLFRAAWQTLLNVMGPCPTFFVVVAPLTHTGLLAQALLAGRAQMRPRRRDRASLLLVALVGAAAVFLVTPFSVENEPGTLNQLYAGQTPARYSLCFSITSAVAALYVAYGLVPRGSRTWHAAITVGVAAIAIWQVWSRVARTWPWLALYYDASDLLLTALNIILAALVVWALVTRATPRGRVYAFCTAALMVCVPAAGVYCLSNWWHRGYAARFDCDFSTDVFTQIERRLRDAARICVLEDRVYPFYGSRRQFHVCNPRTLTSPEALWRYLGHHRVDFVATKRRDWVALDLYGETPRCVDAFPEIYPRLAGGPGFDIRAVKVRANTIFAQKWPAAP